MKTSHKLSDAIHILAYIDIYASDDRSSAAIVDSMESNPSLVRRLMSQLSKAGLLDSCPGAARAQLSKPASGITLLDVYMAVEGKHHLLHVDSQTNQQCLVGANIQRTLSHTYDKVQDTAERQMSEITLQDLVNDIVHRHSDSL